MDIEDGLDETNGLLADPNLLIASAKNSTR